MTTNNEQVVWDKLVEAERQVRDCTKNGQRVPIAWQTARDVLCDLYADLYLSSDPERVAKELEATLGPDEAIPVKYARTGEYSWVEGREISHQGYVEGNRTDLGRAS